jgi:preprotein translocase subunit SecG
MHAVLVVIHLFVAIGLISMILLQRSEGGALGMGGGPGGLMSGRAAGNVLTRATTILAFVFFVTSVALTIFANVNAGGPSLLDRAADAPITAPLGSPADVLGAGQLGGDLLGEQPAGEPAPTGEAPAETTAAPAQAPAAPAEAPAENPQPTEPEGQ